MEGVEKRCVKCTPFTTTQAVTVVTDYYIALIRSTGQIDKLQHIRFVRSDLMTIF